MDSYGNSSFKGVSKKRAELTTVNAKNVDTSLLNVRDTATLNSVTSDSLSVTNGLTVGPDGSQVFEITKGTVSVDPGSITADTRRSVNVTIPNIGTGDRILLQPPSTLNAGLLYVGHDITAANTLTIYLFNKTGGGIDDGALTWKYLRYYFD
jgi:hypothetical protein